MSKQFPTSFEAIRASMLAFLRQCDPHLEKLRDRQLLKAEINRLQGISGNLGTGLKHTGITRPTDSLGRLVIPRELRRTLKLENGSAVEIFFDEEAKAIYLQAYNMKKCVICSSADDLTTINMGFAMPEKHICEECISRVFKGAK